MNKIDTSDWNDFIIGKLFDIHPTKAYKLTNSKLLSDSGSNPVVVNSSYNNGIGGYSELNITEKGNMITFSDTTSVEAIFYQNKDFIGYPHVQGLYPIGEDQNEWNKYSYLFFLTEFKKAAFSLGFNYVKKFTRDIAKEITIKLPVKEDRIDFKFMEKYMQKLELDILTSLQVINSIVGEKNT